MQKVVNVVIHHSKNKSHNVSCVIKEGVFSMKYTSNTHWSNNVTDTCDSQHAVVT